MMGLVMIFAFVIILAVPGFYIITRKVFPKHSKRSAGWITFILTAVLVGILAMITLNNWPM